MDRDGQRRHNRYRFLLFVTQSQPLLYPRAQKLTLDPPCTIGIIGISTYAASALGDVVFVELPTQDTQVSAGDTIGAVESVKSASDILTPVAGTILEGNAVLEEKPATINKAPEGEGWIAKIKVDNVEDLEGLMDAEAYKEYTEE